MGARVPPGYISLQEAARRVGKNYTTLRRWWRSGNMPKPRQIGPNTVAFLEADIIEWERSRPTVSGDTATLVRELKQPPRPRDPMHYVSPTGCLIVRAVEVISVVGEIVGIDVIDGIPQPRFLNDMVERRERLVFVDDAGAEWTFDQLRPQGDVSGEDYQV